MSFFAMLTLVPLTVAVGAALGQVQRFVGPEKIARGRTPPSPWSASSSAPS